VKIDWTALVLVAGVSITMTVVFVVLLAFGIRLVSAANVRVHHGQSGAANQAAGYVLLALAAGLVLLGIYFIVPQFR
jgi:TRAP-type C4-dicarboxylate transport system permease small subunit